MRVMPSTGFIAGRPFGRRAASCIRDVASVPWRRRCGRTTTDRGMGRRTAAPMDNCRATLSIAFDQQLVEGRKGFQVLLRGGGFERIGALEGVVEC